MKIKHGWSTLLLVIVITSTTIANDTLKLESPNQQVQFKLFSGNKQLQYAVTFRGVSIIDPSPFHFLLDNKDITAGATIGTAARDEKQESYAMLGAHSITTSHYKSAVIAIKNGALTYSLEIRAFNEGIAFRTIIPGNAKQSRVPDEATVFNIPAGSTVWYHDLNMHYESVHARKEISKLQAGEWVAPPGTFKLQKGFYAAITEAALVNYPGIALAANGKNGLVMRMPQHQPTSYPYKLRYSPEDTVRLLQPAAITGTITTPWRVVLIGADLNAMVNNDLVLHLNPPPDPNLFPQGLKTSWIKPGRAVWKYLDGGGQGTPEVMKQFTDGAAKLGFEHNILEGFWSRWTDDQIRDLVQYSNQKKVSIWFWKHSKDLRDSATRIAFFKRCHDLGVTGAKIDFFDHEAKEVVDLYASILREAAQYKLLLDFHGANKPTGQARTFPNEMVREAVKGMEASRISDRATHETTIPFTRYLAGPAEYTVTMFNNRRGNTTWTHQIASAAILHAPLLTYAAHPDSLLAHPAADMIKSIPAVWDETVVLPNSEIGELAIFARRTGNTWFLVVMNGVGDRVLRLGLPFLKNRTYQASIVKDVPKNPAAVALISETHKREDVLEIVLASGGGYIARFNEQ